MRKARLMAFQLVSREYRIPKESTEGWKMGIVSVKQSLFLKKWAEDIFNHLQLSQTYLKIRPKFQINTCTENKALAKI